VFLWVVLALVVGAVALVCVVVFGLALAEAAKERAKQIAVEQQRDAQVQEPLPAPSPPERNPTSEKKPPQKEWDFGLQWMDFKTGKTSASRYNTYRATITDLDEQRIGFQIAFVGDTGQPGICRFKWDKETDPNFGLWEQDVPEKSGRWFLRLQGKDRYGGEMYYSNGFRRAITLTAREIPGDSPFQRYGR
jgi:hypothetical protein